MTINSAMAQILVNQDWVQTTGSPTTNIVYQVSTFDPSNNLIVVGNTFTTGEEENFLIVKYNDEGVKLWQTEYNYTGNDTDYATAVTTDGTGNIYVTGAGYNTTDNSYDYLIVKLNPNGTTLWSSVYNFGEGDDIPTAIALDGSDKIYVTGTSKSVNDDFDYATIKLDYNGNVEWSKRYDHNSLPDVAAGIVIDGDVIVVTGGSANTGIEWDYATVVYDDEGIELDVERTTTGIVGIDQPTAITKDNNGNFYITGVATQNSANYDIQTIKIDANYDVVWTQTYDRTGQEDKGNDIVTDNSGNVYVAGHSFRNGTKEWLIVKYNAQGVEQWAYTRPPFDNGTAISASQIAFNNGYLYVTGSSDAGGHTDFYTACYDTNGEIQWERHYNSSGTQNDVPLSVSVDNDGDVYVVGEVVSGSGEYVTVKYSQFDSHSNIEYVNGEASHLKNEIIIRFNPNVINTAVVDNQEKLFGTVAEVITDPSLISMLATEFKTGSNFDGWKMKKVFRKMTTQHTYSQARTGQWVEIPKFWSTYVLVAPQNLSIDEAQKSTNLMQPSFSPYIISAEPNSLGQLMVDAQDPEYVNGEQYGLFAPQGSGYEDADIEIEGAWDFVYPSGGNTSNPNITTNIKVGVYDTGIDWRHEDFGDGTFAGSKIAGGWSWDKHVHISSLNGTGTGPTNLNGLPDDVGHGTSCASIIGALRNNVDDNGNYVGVAGIAGGDMDHANSGVELFAMRIAHNNLGLNGITEVPREFLLDAIFEGALYNPNLATPGYGLHIMNHAWGDDAPTNEERNALASVVYFAYRNGVVFVASRGNNDQTTNWPINQEILPATFRDDWVLSVGASGDDGEFYDGSNSNPASTITNVTLNGKDMDLIAPGINELVRTADNATTGYVNFNGTSAAAPHAAGVAALLMGYFNDPNGTPSVLANDDIENILEISAEDKDIAGYDDESGWGLLQADDALQAIDKQQFKIWHFPEQGGTMSRSSNITSIFTPIELTHSAGGLPPGLYRANEYEVTLTYSHNTNATILNAWERNMLAEGYGELDSFKECELVSWNNNQAVLRTFVYEITHDGHPPFTTYPNSFWLMNINNTSCPYTLRTAISTNTDKVVEVNNSLLVYPNPTQDNAEAIIELEEGTLIDVKLVDINGRTIQQIFTGKKIQGKHTFDIDLSEVAAGVYFCVLQTDQKIVQQKLVKTN